MANNFIIVGDYDTDRLAASVNQRISEGYIPNGGLFYYQCRFNQQMMTGSCDVPYFIVNATNGSQFSQEVNQMINSFSPDAAGLGETMEINSRFIQAYGCEYAFGDSSGGQGLKWYTQDAAGTYPIIDAMGSTFNLNTTEGTVMSVASGVTAVNGTTSASLNVGNNGVTVTPTTAAMVAGDCYTSVNTSTYSVSTPYANGQILLSIGNYTKFMATRTITVMDFSQGPVAAKVRMDSTGLNLETLTDAPVIIRSNNVTSLVANNGTTTLSGTNGSVVTDATGATILSSDSTANQSKWVLTNNGLTVDTHGEHLYNIDGQMVFFSSGDITKVSAGSMYLEIDEGANTILTEVSYVPTEANSVATKGYVDDNRPVPAVFRASFTTTGAEVTQYVTAVNTPQVVTFNAQAIPDSAIGTLNNTTGVFTAARNIVGLLSVNCQVRRSLGLLTVMNWGFQVETSTDGVAWTPMPGSARRMTIPASDTGVIRNVELTTAIDIAPGSRFRITQFCDNAASNTGLVSMASGLGGTTSAGVIMSLSTIV